MSPVLAKSLPLLIVAEAGIAAVMYAIQRDWRHAFYWGSCACITLSATLL